MNNLERLQYYLSKSLTFVRKSLASLHLGACKYLHLRENSRMDTASDMEEKGQLHTIESVRFTIQQLKNVLSQMEGSLLILDVPPRIEQLQIPYESSRVNGLKRLQSWADGLRKAANEARSEVANKPVSDSLNGAKKARK